MFNSSSSFPITSSFLKLINQDNVVVVLNEWMPQYKSWWQVIKDRDWDYLWYGPSLQLSSSYYEDGVFYLTPRHYEEFKALRHEQWKKSHAPQRPSSV